MPKKIIVVGSINLDLVAKVARMPGEGETLTGQSFATYCGGKGANQAVGVARLGGNVLMVGRVGNDGFSEQLRRGLEEAGVDTAGVRNVESASGVAMITVTERGGNSIVVIPGANAALLPADLDELVDEFREAAMVLAQLETPLETVNRLSELTTALGIPLMLDPAPAQALPAELLQRVTWLTPNESEARGLLQSLGHLDPADMLSEPSLQDAADGLLATGVRNVVLKLGRRGVYLSGKDVASQLLPAVAVEAVDSTAAGDAFNAGLAYALARGVLPKQAAEFACVAAAISVTRVGAQPSMASLAEVECLMGERPRWPST